MRKTEEIPYLDILKEGLPTSYASLQKELKSQKSSKKSFFNLSYFKSLESSAKVKFYLNKEKKDFDSMTKARKKAQEIAGLKAKIEQEKRSISTSITAMNKEQNQLKRDKEMDQLSMFDKSGDFGI